MRRRAQKGFTLIELLVVIAIIAILAAILFPVFAKARDKARQATCQSNLKQLGLAFLQYVQDYDEMPGALYWYDRNLNGFIYWFQYLYPYVKNKGVYACPSHIVSYAGYMPGDQYTGDNGYGGWENGVRTSTLSYSINYVVLGWNIAQLQSPADIFLMWDSDGGWCWTEYDPPGRDRFRPAIPRHSDGDCYSFCDGHVKWFRRESVPYYDVRFTVH